MQRLAKPKNLTSKNLANNYRKNCANLTPYTRVMLAQFFYNRAGQTTIAYCCSIAFFKAKASGLSAGSSS